MKRHGRLKGVAEGVGVFGAGRVRGSGPSLTHTLQALAHSDPSKDLADIPLELAGFFASRRMTRWVGSGTTKRRPADCFLCGGG